MMGQWVHYALLIFLSTVALVAFVISWWKKKFDWTEEASQTVFMDESDE